MGRFAFLPCALLSLQAFLTSSFATNVAAEEADTIPEVPTLAVSVQTSFPTSEIFGIKLVNGQPTQALVSFSNDEDSPVVVNFVGGSLWSTDDIARIVRNLTTTSYGVEIPAGQKETIPFNFVTEMHPQDLRLNLVSVVSDSQNRFFTLEAFNGTVSIVEQEASIFDPEVIFLYFFILAFFAGIAYFVYSVWIAPYFPQKRKGKSGDKKAGGTKKVEPVDSTADSTSAVSSATTYNADWIPAHHIQPPQARKVKGTSKPKPRA
jgi:lipopolysaccharide export LptBFGC system permease protein LptF